MNLLDALSYRKKKQWKGPIVKCMSVNVAPAKDESTTKIQYGQGRSWLEVAAHCEQANLLYQCLCQRVIGVPLWFPDVKIWLCLRFGMHYECIARSFVEMRRWCVVWSDVVRKASSLSLPSVSVSVSVRVSHSYRLYTERLRRGPWDKIRSKSRDHKEN